MINYKSNIYVIPFIYELVSYCALERGVSEIKREAVTSHVHRFDS